MVNMKTKTKDKLDIKSIELEAIVDYARVHSPSTANSTVGTYSVSIRLTTPEEVKSLKQLFKEHNVSLTVLNPVTEEKQSRLRDNKDGTFSFNVKRDAVSSTGKVAVIDVVDAEGNPIPKNILIGNGSRAIVHMFSYQGKKGGVLRLSGLQVLDLVPFKPNKFKKHEGFKVSSTSAQLTESEGELEDDDAPF